ncbi:MAG TPA: NAD-dependent epimerase/dehydratase family protein [Gemmatimonadales bacterium]|jgi:nucleoside-diphosphate-sugar epimerase|nr:NAD-dependent epimerase/dehydratase family protein [Gemmatimonadales bacterium]
MTVLVTGGSGLVGSHVIEALRARGEPVRALVRKPEGIPGVEEVVGDVTDASAWRRAAGGARAIVHGAAVVANRVPYEAFERVNVGGTRLAVHAARAEGATLVHVSSVAVFGRTAAETAGREGITEDFPFQRIPERDFYARTKRLAEELVREEAARGGVTAVAIRPNVIYGERDRLFTPRVIGVLRRGFAVQIGPGTNHLSCVYAGNVAAAIVAAVDKARPGFRAYNVTRDAPPELTQREFFMAFAAALGIRLRFVPVPVRLARWGAKAWSRWLRLRHPRRYAGLAGAAVSFIVGENPYVAARARQDLGWTPPYDARAGIQRAVAWFQSGA